MSGRSRSGLPQIRDGPVDPSLPNFRFVLRLRLHLDFLEGDDMSLELVGVLFQRLLLSSSIIAVESRMLSVTI